MKITKRLFAVVLTMALALSLALPTMAVDEEPNPAIPVITVQPKGGRVRASGRLTVQAYIPNGDEIGYAWFCSKASGIHSRSDGMNVFAGEHSYYVKVYNVTNPELCVTSETVLVEGYKTLLERIGEAIMFPITLFTFPTGLSFLLLPVYPIILLIQWIVGLF